MQEDRSSSDAARPSMRHERIAQPDDNSSSSSSPTRRPLLAVPVGREPDWYAATQRVEALTRAELEDLAEEASAILGQRRRLPARSVRNVLRTAVADVRAAWNGARLPDARDDRERHMMGAFDVLTEPMPPLGRPPTFLYCSVRLLECADLLDALVEGVV